LAFRFLPRLQLNVMHTEVCGEFGATCVHIAKSRERSHSEANDAVCFQRVQASK